MDDLGRLDTPLHRLDPRTKCLTTAVFIVVVMSFPRYEVSALMPLCAYPFALVALGNLPLGYLARRVALAAPFALFVGIFNPFLDREPVLRLGAWAVSGGCLSFASIMLRFGLTVSAALILVASTGIHRLCAGLERLGLPRVLAVQILFMYRYLFVIGDEGGRMLRSIEVRSAGTPRLPFRVYATLLGHLLLRSLDRAQRIYRAMVSRGFEGEVRFLAPTTLGWRDAVFGVAWSAFFGSARLWNLAEALGGWVSRSVS